MPNLNAALLLAQLENLSYFIKNKRNLANKYKLFFSKNKYNFFIEPKNSKSNYWLNTIFLKSKKERDKFLFITNKNNIMTRPVWKLMSELKMFKDCECIKLKNAKYLQDLAVNIPSSVKLFNKHLR